MFASPPGRPTASYFRPSSFYLNEVILKSQKQLAMLIFSYISETKSDMSCLKIAVASVKKSFKNAYISLATLAWWAACRHTAPLCYRCPRFESCECFMFCLWFCSRWRIQKFTSRSWKTPVLVLHDEINKHKITKQFFFFLVMEWHFVSHFKSEMMSPSGVA